MTNKADTQELLPPSCGPAIGLSNEDLVSVALESYGRSFIYPSSKVNHDRWVECRAELLSRLARTPSTPAVDPQPVAAGEQEDSVAARAFKTAHLIEGRDLTTGKRITDQPSVSPQPTEAEVAALADKVNEQVKRIEESQKIDPELWTVEMSSVSPSEECLMADCHSPQEHFCYRHCLEVYGTKSVDDERLSLLAARPDVQTDDARVERLQAQLDGVMNCLAISQQEVERLRARPDVWEQAILIVQDWHNLSGRAFNKKYGYNPDGLVNLVETLESARDAQPVASEPSLTD